MMSYDQYTKIDLAIRWFKTFVTGVAYHLSLKLKLLTLEIISICCSKIATCDYVLLYFKNTCYHIIEENFVEAARIGFPNTYFLVGAFIIIIVVSGYYLPLITKDSSTKVTFKRRHHEQKSIEVSYNLFFLYFCIWVQRLRFDNYLQ